ncbi:zinc finger MYM-type protein 2-like [Halichondria panicea]|uniref:zinc finger MYM-type protein 2-like n=1 Tax=Halichondria panicea TaxID=6063 RepID=UPI00312BC49C
MDSTDDANRQLRANKEDFCRNSHCLGKEWHGWGCCSTPELESPSLLSSVTEELLRMSNIEEPMHVQVPQNRYAPPTTDEAVTKARAESVPKKTRDDTAYCVKLWHDWASNRKILTDVVVPSLMGLDKKEMQYWLCRFVLEVRTKKGTEYAPNTLYHLICGIMRYVRQQCEKPEIDFFKDPEFAQFRSSLDAEMKRLQATGLGSTRKQAEPLSMQEEELLWEKKLLGDHCPAALLNTMAFMNWLYFALRSGGEHRQLRHIPCQIEVFDNPQGRSCLRYTEDISKNHPGGLKGRKHKQKVVVHHSNIENPTRCFVRLFQKYSTLCLPERPSNALYLTPLAKPKNDDCWFSKVPLGHNSLKDIVKNMCLKAGIPGYKTNHSLRATTATRLYSNGVDEQLVMERTGHRSIEGIRSYKRTSSEQQENISDLLNGKKPCMDLVPASNKQPFVPMPALPLSLTRSPTLPSSCSQVVTSNVSAPQHSSSKNDHAGAFHLSSCSNISINFHYSNT